ncbi:fimbria/pilus outer membrane usher protein [Serratia sp. IR-2025]
MPIRAITRSGHQYPLNCRGGLCLLCLSTFCVQAQEYSSLPDAPGAAPVITNAMFYLTLVVNGQSDGQVVPVTYRDNAYYVEAGVLAKNHVQTKGQQGLIKVEELPGVKVKYDSAAQQLIFQVPDAWLPKQDVGGGELMNYTMAQSSTGLLLNYDSYYTDPHEGSRSVATWMEQRLFSNLGFISNTGTYRYNIDTASGEGGSAVQDRYLRYDTFWRYSDEQDLISYQLGDFVSNSLTWSNSARMGGLRISRNFALRPDLVTYPLLQYSGTAAVPSTVDLFLNGFKASSNNLNSGPFTLTNVPYINGAGEATIVTTDAVGRQVSTTVPFYVSNTLLRKNLSDFDVSLGAVRQDYGISNGDYSDAAFSGIYRYGLSNYLTLSGHSEATQGLALGGLGADIAVGTWGTLSLSASQSKANHPPVATSDVVNDQIVRPNTPGMPHPNQNIDNPLGTKVTDKKDGSQYTLGYSYNSTLFSFSAQRASRTVGYQDLTSYTSNTRLSRQSDQATFSASPFGSSNGTLGLGYYDVQAYDNSHTRLVNFSYSRALWGQSSMFVSLNKTLGDNGYSAQLQFIIPLGSDVSLNAGLARNNNGHYQHQVGASKAAPTDGGMGWNLAYSGGGDAYQQADATWKTRYATLQGGIFGPQGEYTNWADLSGSVVFMANSWFLSDKINDAFIVVDTDNYAGVSVLYENQKMGTTDSNGHLLIPSISSYYPAKVEIDTLPLPADVVANQVNNRIAVKQGSGMVVKFPVQKVLSANITLHDTAGQPLKLGTLVTEQTTQQTTVVGYDGLVYFSHLQSHGQLSIQQDDRSMCRVDFDLNPNYHSIEQVGPLVCQGSAEEKKS